MLPTITVLRGDGVGPEVIEAALSVLGACHPVKVREALIGGAAIDATGDPLPPEPEFPLLCLVVFASTVCIGAFGPLLPEIARAQGLPDWELGLLAGRDNDELRWLAFVLRRALRLGPALPADEPLPSPNRTDSANVQDS